MLISFFDLLVCNLFLYIPGLNYNFFQINFEALFIHSKMYPLKSTFMRSDKFINLCNYHHNKNIAHFHHSKCFPIPLYVQAPFHHQVQAIFYLIYVTIVFFPPYSITLYKWNHIISSLVYGFFQALYQSAQAMIVKCHILSTLNNRNLFSHGSGED